MFNWGAENWLNKKITASKNRGMKLLLCLFWNHSYKDFANLKKYIGRNKWKTSSDAPEWFLIISFDFVSDENFLPTRYLSTERCNLEQFLTGINRLSRLKGSKLSRVNCHKFSNNNNFMKIDQINYLCEFEQGFSVFRSREKFQNFAKK